MIDSEIRVGDVVRDLTQNALMQVVDVADVSVAEYSELEGYDLAGYKSHPLFDVDEDEPVFSCVYLGGELTVPSKSYDFPASRLARVPTEEANEALRRVQESIIVDVLEALFATAARDDMASDREALFDVATHAGIDEGLVDEARELADVEATIGGRDEPTRHEPADFGHGESTGVQDLGTIDEEVSE